MNAAALLADPIVAAACHAAAALVLGLSVAPKLRDLARFQAAFAAYGLLPPAWTRAGALAFVAAEGAAALGMVLLPQSPGPALAGLAVAGLATAAVAVNLARGRRELRCGCGAAADSMPISGALLARNAGLLAVLAVAAASTSSSLAGAAGISDVAGTGMARALGTLDWAAAAFCALALLLLWLAATQLLVNAGRARG